MTKLRLYVYKGYADTPFTAGLPENVFKAGLADPVEDPFEADWVVSGRLRPLLPLIARRPRIRILIWTNEPRHSRCLKKRIKIGRFGPHIEFMNVFTGDVFWHNLHFFSSYHFDIWSDLGIPQRPLEHMASGFVAGRDWRRVSAVFTNRLDMRTKWSVGGVDRDLEVKRAELALAGSRRNLTDIYGHGWPDGIAKEASRAGSSGQSWWDRKLSLLRQSGFNIALENTSWPYYCTEKIWHPIVAGCLPIYWGKGNAIYETFPEDSFLDLARYASYEDLYDHIERMSVDEYVERYNRCVDAFNAAQEHRRLTKHLEPAEHIRRIAERICPEAVVTAV